MLKLADEMHAASAYICEHGKIEIGTPQSRRLIETVQMGRQLGIEPTIPNDYPMDTSAVGHVGTVIEPGSGSGGKGRIGSRTAADFTLDLMTGREVDND
jgi:hypothetical protein